MSFEALRSLAECPASRIDPSVRLRRAIFSNDLVLARRIIKNNPQCMRTPDINDKGNTPLHLAASLGFIEIAMFLVEAGHEDQGISRNFDRETPLMCAVGSITSSLTPYSSSIAGVSGSSGAVASAITNSTSSNSVSGLGIIPSAASTEDMVRLLAARFPRCITWTSRSGLDAFQVAAQRGSDRILSLLLSLSPNRTELLSHASADGNTALHLASAWGNMKCISVLVNAGADPMRKNEGGYSPIDYSSTVSAEVYFRGMVIEMEKKQRDAVAQAVVDKEIKTRRRGGSKPEMSASPGPAVGTAASSVRLVDDREDAIIRARSPSLKGIAPPPPPGAAREPTSGRATPIGWRENWVSLGLRGRAGSTE